MYNHAIRRIQISTGEVTTLWGRDRDVGLTEVGTAARPGVCRTQRTYLYVADWFNHTVRFWQLCRDDLADRRACSGTRMGSAPRLFK